MWEVFKDIVGFVVPSIDDDPKAQYRWRVAVALLIIGGITLNVLHIALACGFITSAFPGFASAADLASAANRTDWKIKRFEEKQDVVNGSILSSFILAAQDKVCAADRAKDYDKAQTLNVNLHSLLDSYHYTTGDFYQLTPCEQQ